MIRDLQKPEAEHQFIWDEVPPEDYPEEMKEMRSFVRLVRFWNETRKTT